jgi:hypothetical protein
MSAKRLRTLGGTAVADRYGLPDRMKVPGDDNNPPSSFILTSRNRGTKVVAVNNRADAQDARLLGYLASPFEPRIMVLVGRITRAFEGNEERLDLHGAHLTVGFRK